jgi:hypothetical protein
MNHLWLHIPVDSAYKVLKEYTYDSKVDVIMFGFALFLLVFSYLLFFEDT